jgi:hypothetical protein
VWRITLDVIGWVKVTVTWKIVARNLIGPEEFRELLAMSETAEVFAGMILDRVAEIVGEPMLPYASNCLGRDIVQWCNDNHHELAELRLRSSLPRRVEKPRDEVGPGHRGTT